MGKQLNADLIKKLCKKYTPSSLIDMQFRGADITFKTDDEGNPVLLFTGKRKEKCEPGFLLTIKLSLRRTLHGLSLYWAYATRFIINKQRQL